MCVWISVFRRRKQFENPIIGCRDIKQKPSLILFGTPCIRTGKNTKSKLAFHVCNLKSKNIQHDISWEIVTRAPQFNHSTRVCRLCLMEAYHIIFTPGGANLNKRDELFGFCKHKEKNLLRKHPT